MVDILNRYLFIFMFTTLIIIYFDGLVLLQLKGMFKKLINVTVKPDPEFGLDFTVSYSALGGQKMRSNKAQSAKSHQSFGEECQQPARLENIDQVSYIENGLFMIESSGRGTLNTRQACAVESAAMRSGLVVHVVMFSSQLDLKENTTCQLYMSQNNIKFYTVDLDTFAATTPLESFFTSDQLEGHPFSTVHKSDALRLLLVYKFGGFYLDLDYVVLQDLTHYNNMVVGNEEISPHAVTNNVFSFSRHHRLPFMALQLVQKKYDPQCWACIGPKLITHCVKEIANTTLIQNIPDSANINFIPNQVFMPVHWDLLFPETPTAFQEWRKIFNYSSAVHFSNSATAELEVVDDPQYSAYALLGPRYCPLAYYSDKNF